MYNLIHGDCLEVMRTLDAESVDAVVTDPPYGLEFMGKDWDKIGTGRAGNPFDPHGQMFREGGSIPLKATPVYGRKRMPKCKKCGGWRYNASKSSECQCVEPEWETDTWTYPQKMQDWHEEWAREALRVLKPGGYLLAFGGSRTYHRLACAVEDAGFEIRDMIEWLYGSGFPKSLDVSKAMDKAAGAEREIVAEGGPVKRMIPGAQQNATGSWIKNDERTFTPTVTAPATDLARQWEGWGTALKPAHEPIVVARKPLIGTVAQNVERYGTGAINVDGCRVGGGGYHWRASDSGKTSGASFAGGSFGEGPHPAGRFPANLCLDETAAEMLDEQTGDLAANAPALNRRGATTGTSIGGQGRYGTSAPQEVVTGYGDSGGASRFFYVAKASGEERGEGNTHPTVKPVMLMRWLVRLVTPPAGVVLDPFAGSGTTLVAALEEGFGYIGIEREEEYVTIARRRLEIAQPPLFGTD